MKGKKSNKRVEVLKYDPNWPRLYERAEKRILEALQENLIEIHHVGSTSVPGLSAKPKIDILAVVKDPQKAVSQLESHQIEYCGEYNIPMHYGFRMRGDLNVNLHVYEKNHPEVELNLLFRDYLRCHPEAVKEYEKLKYEILQDASSFSRNSLGLPNYTLRKGSFIRNILKKAGFEKLRMIKCSDPYECESVQKLSPEITLKDLEDLDFEYLALYRGCDIIGYACIHYHNQGVAKLEIIKFQTKSLQEQYQDIFLSNIRKWLERKGLKTSL